MTNTVSFELLQSDLLRVFGDEEYHSGCDHRIREDTDEIAKSEVHHISDEQLHGRLPPISDTYEGSCNRRDDVTNGR